MVGSRDRAYKRRWLLSWSLRGPQSSAKPEVKKGADVFDTMNPMASGDLPEEASMAFKVLRDATYSTCALPNKDF